MKESFIWNMTWLVSHNLPGTKYGQNSRTLNWYSFNKQNSHLATCSKSGTRLSSVMGYKGEKGPSCPQEFFFFFNPREVKPVLQPSTTWVGDYLLFSLKNSI